MPTAKYTLDFLKEFCKENNIIYEDIDEWKGRDTKIKGKCKGNNCINSFCKGFRELIIHCGAYCTKCSKKIQQEKSKATNIIRLGVDNPMKSKDIQEKVKITNINKLGVKYPSQSVHIKNKKEKTCIEKYGVSTTLLVKEIQDKIKKTCIDRYGTENPLSSKYIQNIIKETNIKKWGVENPMQATEVKEKSKSTIFMKYGVEHHSQLQSIKNKFKNTCIIKYGVEHPMQNAIIADYSSKRAYALKQYKFPSGNVINIQGYEPFALDVLINNGIHENDIITSKKEVPEIWYHDDNGKEHRYFLDIYIPSINKCIEVKSLYTYEIDKEKIKRTKKSVEEKGHIFECWIFDNKHLKII